MAGRPATSDSASRTAPSAGSTSSTRLRRPEARATDWQHALPKRRHAAEDTAGQHDGTPLERQPTRDRRRRAGQLHRARVDDVLGERIAVHRRRADLGGE